MRRRFRLVELLDQRRALVVPRRSRVGGAAEDVAPLEARAGDEGNVFGLEPRAGQEPGHLLPDLLEPSLRPVGHVHLVDGHDDALDAYRPDEEGMFFGLASQAGFEVARRRVDDEHRKVRLAGAGDHVGHEVAVPGGVEDGEAGLFRLELVGGDVDGDAACPLLGALVEDPGEGERSFADGLGFFAVLVHRPLVDGFQVEQESSHERALAGVNVAYTGMESDTPRHSRGEGDTHR